MSARSIAVQVDAALKGVPEDWRTTLARTLAETLDAEPNASMARELRSVMGQLEESKPREASGADEIAARRARRRKTAAG